MLSIVQFVILSMTAIYAQPSNERFNRALSFQGTIQDGAGTNLSGVHTLRVRIYADANGSQLLWQGHYSTTIDRGLFNVMLGTGTDTFPSSLDFSHPLWVGTQVDGESEMRPLTRLSASASTLSIPDNSVTQSKMGTDYVGSVSLNGKKVTSRGGDLNLVDGPNGRFIFDEQSSSLSIDGSHIGGGTPQTAIGTVYWSETGNKNTTPGTNYIGTYDSAAIEIHVHDSDLTTGGVIKLIPSHDAPNIISGANTNSITSGTYGASILGGARHSIDVDNDYSTISGGKANTIAAHAKNSVIHGGVANSIDDASIAASIGGGFFNEVKDSSYYATITGGLSLVAQGYAQTVMGRYNTAQGSAKFDTIIGDDRLLILGNGSSSDHRSNAFEVSNNGHSIVYHTNDSGFNHKAIEGATYKDNIIYAWGNVEVDGGAGKCNMIDRFGDVTATYNGVGDYTIVVRIVKPDGGMTYLESGAIAITTRNKSCVFPISGVYTHDSVSTSFPVNISQHTLGVQGGISTIQCQNTDSDFYFIITGRPKEN